MSLEESTTDFGLVNSRRLSQVDDSSSGDQSRRRLSIPAYALNATNIALAGTYLTNFGSYITVNDGTWYTVASYGTSMYHIHAFEGSYIIAQNSANNSYNAGQWSKFEFHATSGGGYGYCQSVYNAATANAAYNTDTSYIYNAADASAKHGSIGPVAAATSNHAGL